MFVFLVLMLDFKHLKLLFFVVHIFFHKLLQNLVASEQFGNLQRALWLVYFKTTQQKEFIFIHRYSKKYLSLPVLVLWTKLLIEMYL